MDQATPAWIAFVDGGPAAAMAARITGLKKNRLYQQALLMKK